MPELTDKQELRAGRLAAAGAILLAGYMGYNPPGFVAQVVAFAFGLAAASLFPALLLVIFSLRMNAAGAISGMLTGLLFTLVVLGASLAYVATAARFAFGDPQRGARLVLYSSLVYLPLVFAVALLDPVVSPFLRP